MQNEVFERKAYLSLDQDYTYAEIEHVVYDIIWCDLYSYFVGRKDNTIVIKAVVSTTPEFNTLTYPEPAERIIEAIIDYMMVLSDVKCICFGQPPIELIAELYQPMIHKMATRISVQWKQFEYDDLVGIGNKVMVELYRKGYYLNKALIWTAFNNDVLVQCRKFKDKPITVSIYDKTNSDVKLDSEELTYGDMLEDTSYADEKEKEDEQQLEQYIFEQVKEIVIDKIGKRQWDELWRDYSKCHTTGKSQAAMRRIKAYFNELGLTRQDFINGYRR